MENNNLLIGLLKSQLNQFVLMGKHFSFSEQNVKGKFDANSTPAPIVTFNDDSQLSVTTKSGKKTLSVTGGWLATVKDKALTLIVFGGFTENNEYTYYKLETT